MKERLGREGGERMEERGGAGDKVGRSDLKKKRKEFSGKVGIREIGGLWDKKARGGGKKVPIR
jgi:hypothetical protein